jgi:hypothetical protein
MQTFMMMGGLSSDRSGAKSGVESGFEREVLDSQKQSKVGRGNMEVGDLEQDVSTTLGRLVLSGCPCPTRWAGYNTE